MQDNIEKLISDMPGPILILGASGFIGSNLLRKILTVRSDVIGTSTSFNPWRLNEVSYRNLICINLLNQKTLQSLITNLQPKTVFNCVAYGAYSFQQNEELIYETNFNLTTHIVKLLKTIPDFHAYVHAGSSSEYGTNCSNAKEYDTHCYPNSPYAVSKCASASFLLYEGRTYNFPCINLRLFSVYGPYEDSSRLIPQLIKYGREGSYPPFVNPDITRDFVYVDDVCTAFVKAAHTSRYMCGSSINVGTGIPTSIRRIAILSKQIFEIDNIITFGDMHQRAWDNVFSIWYANTNNAKDLLNWTYTTTLQQGIEKTLEWINTINVQDYYSSSKQGVK